jgi:hypothetical protein
VHLLPATGFKTGRGYTEVLKVLAPFYIGPLLAGWSRKDFHQSASRASLLILDLKSGKTTR